jgi:hypothetical protein
MNADFQFGFCLYLRFCSRHPWRSPSRAGAENMRRIQGEFHKALHDLGQKSVHGGQARVIPLNGNSR